VRGAAHVAVVWAGRRVLASALVELRHLRYFVAVAEELHFGRAATRLRISQPPLSQQIRQLEAELEVVLFHRTRRRVELTAAGRAFLPEAQRVLEQADRAARSARRASRGEIGELAIGFVPSADLDLLPRVLRLWKARVPDVPVELHALFPEQQIQALRQGRIQVGLVRLPVDESDLVVEPIRREPLVAVLPARHPLARRARVRLADLASEPMILFPRRVAPGYRDLFVAACRRAGFVPRRAPETESIQTNLGLVAAGLGVTLMPASIRSLQRAGAVYRPLAPPVPHVDMAAAYGREDRSTIVPPFLAVLREAAARRPGWRGERSAQRPAKDSSSRFPLR
jgi:DNA-binding transcriptional LysR family regulator